MFINLLIVLKFKLFFDLVLVLNCLPKDFNFILIGSDLNYFLPLFFILINSIITINVIKIF